jgi:acyl-CoA thioester hydrolase
MSDQSTEAIRSTPLYKKDFSFFEAVTLRWADNDAYGHINNAHYYSFFDTAVDAFLLHYNLRPHVAGVYQTLVVASECRYFSQVSAPGTIQVGVRPGRLGRSSITYEVAVFTSDSDLAAAQGLFVHVCVDRQSQRPEALPAPFRKEIERLKSA